MDAQTAQTRETIAEMFGRVAPRYDLLNRLMTGGRDQAWRRETVVTLKPFPAEGRYLDLATGTGDLALALLQQAGTANIHIDALDVSPEMLGLARRKISTAGLETRFSFQQAAAEALPFPSETFDGVTVGFGVRNFADREQGLREIHRVLKPGAKLAILEASPPENRAKRLVQWLHTSLSVRLLGRFLSDPQAYRYLGASISRFPPPGVFLQTLRALGFQHAAVRSLGLGAVAIFSAEK